MSSLFDKDIPFVPSSASRLNTMVELARVSPGEKSVDLGSGDGRVVIAMAQLGAHAFGFEIDPELVKRSMDEIKKANLEGKAFIIYDNFLSQPLNTFDLITVYGITSLMGKLEKKLKDELKPGARVVSNYFTFPSWKYKDSKEDVYLYLR